MYMTSDLRAEITEKNAIDVVIFNTTVAEFLHPSVRPTPHRRSNSRK